MSDLLQETAHRMARMLITEFEDRDLPITDLLRTLEKRDENIERLCQRVAEEDKA